MTEPVAIVGLGGVFPGAANLGEFRKNVREGRSASKEIPVDRWPFPPRKVYAPEVGRLDHVYSLHACLVEDFNFNPQGFEIDADWLLRLDPQNHFLLQAGRQAFLDAVTGPLDLARVGVIMGNIALPTDGATAITLNILGSALAEKVTGRAFAIKPGRAFPVNRYVTGLPAGVLARSLGLGGGSYTLDAACASSLYALKLAADELLSGRADAMLAGGLSRPDCLYTQMGFSQLRALSASGVSAPFDAAGDGLVVGEGCGVAVLKRLGDALEHGDKIYGVLRGFGLSNDTAGHLLAPDSSGQLRAMRQAYQRSGWEPWSVDYIECHGTGTPVGDVMEYESLCRLWAERPQGAPRAALGSVKANIGHLLTGAGASGLIKILLALEDETLPPLANFSRAKPEIERLGGPFDFPTEARPWPRTGGKPRRAALSAFGFGGVNAHVLIEDWNGDDREVRRTKIKKTAFPDPPAVAVVGLGGRFGPFSGLDDLAEAFFKNASGPDGLSSRSWWVGGAGIWLGRRARLCPGQIQRIFSARPGKRHWRIPDSAQRAVPDAAATTADAPDRGGRVERRRSGRRPGGSGRNLHRPETWTLAPPTFTSGGRPGNGRNSGLGILSSDGPPEALAEWASCLADAASPPLTADRVLGALGSIAASRIGREFKCGGPCHTVSDEETSGFRALEVGFRALQNREIDMALIGAVDLAGDARSLWGAEACRGGKLRRRADSPGRRRGRAGFKKAGRRLGRRRPRVRGGPLYWRSLGLGNLRDNAFTRSNPPGHGTGLGRGRTRSGLSRVPGDQPERF